MNIAVIGSGFAGLAVSYFLLHYGHRVTLFDDCKKGASHVATGLMHPYAGERGLRSPNADAGLLATLALIAEVEKELSQEVILGKGIFRKILTEEMEANLQKAAHTFGDVLFVTKELCHITSGVCINTTSYLSGLKALCSRSPNFLLQKKTVNELDEIKAEYDHSVFACGYGIRKFLKVFGIKLKFTKGQVLILNTSSEQLPHQTALIAKGYVAPYGKKVLLGSTYEREFIDETPSLPTAEAILAPRIEEHFPFLKHDYSPLEVLSGIRVAQTNSSMPLAMQLDQGTSILTGFGSKGLLYHALFAKTIAANLSS
jgi:glycine/D-amino acid oxidase-like deaminating enzyme